jgi:predicted DNA-binding transcriptional regulator AlpA
MSAIKPPTQANASEDPSIAELAKRIEELVRTVVPARTDRFLRQREVLPLSGFGSLSTLKNKIREGEFPPPIRISEGRQAWSEREIVEWQERQIAARNAILASRNGTASQDPQPNHSGSVGSRKRLGRLQP